MIDEFQDTSAMQWNNFIPLVNDSMGGGNDNLVVGDVKQSIYRFRNSKWQILADMQERLVDNERFLRVPLITNFRSRSGIIRFNNALFSVLPALFEKSLPDVDGIPGFTSIYSEAVQDDPGRKEGGFVRLEFVEAPADETGGTRTAASGRKWRESVLEKLPGVLESFQENGYKASDIGILVRESKDGADVLKAIARYADNVPPDLRKKYNYNVVSNDSLTLSNSPAVKFLIATLNVMIDGSDLISRARMLRFFLMSKGDENAESAPLYGDTLLDKNNTYFPAGYPDFLERVSLMPLFEITENIISFFGLGDYPAHVPYLFAFQDLILNFSGRRSHGIQSFLDWWETTGKYKSVVLSPGVDAAMVYTIHKSKGLEFKVVIIPFMSWNLDHKTRHQPILWIKPDTRPFSASGIVPVRYKKDLEETIFADSYAREKVSSYLDNLNLLYVAMTRAIDAIWGFLPDEPGKTDSMAGKVKEALVTGNSETGEQEAFLAKHYNSDTRVFEMGTIPRVNSAFTGDPAMECHNYAVSRKPASLRLKLHGENYFARGSDAVRQKINRGNILHEIFAGINTSDDTRLALSRLVIEGKLSEDESASLALRLETLISGEPVSGWFKPGNIVMVEAVILLPRGQVRRPDRVIIEGNSATLIDFKTGVEVNHHLDQMNEYLSLLDEMGFKNTKAFLWYIDINKIVRVA
jgi:CRISPR/Cas system-associated exonuclease Cas4 (RecB family)